MTPLVWEIPLFIVFMFGMITQVIVPFMFDMPYFPLFRENKLRKFERELRRLEREAEEQKVQHELDRRQIELARREASHFDSSLTELDKE